jgi:hypothetical protein
MPDFGRWNSAGGDPSLNEINRTDQFLDALAAQQPPYSTDRDEAELANLLAGWRDDVRETPMGHVLTPQDAAAALDRATRPAPRRRLSLAVLGSAAAAVLAIGGVGAVVAGSGPGDALYGLRTMFFGEQTQTRDDAVILAAQTEMQQVQQLIEQGDWQGAQAKLEAVTTTVATVDDIERKQELVTQWQELTVKVEAQDPAATIAPDAVLPTFPDVPVVILEPDAPVTGPTSETPDTPAPSETTSPSSTTETTSPSSATETTAPSSTAAPTSTTATQAPAPSTSVATTPTPTTPTPTSATPTSPSNPTTAATTPSNPTTATTTPTTAITTTAPRATTTLQATSTAQATTPQSTTARAPQPTPTPTPTAVPPVEEETVAPETPTVPLPTTTTPVIPLPVPGGVG